MKVIFLDIDGVINIPSAELGFANMKESWRKLYQDSDTVNRLKAYAHVFSPSALYNLRRIIDETEAKIVISSTWRLRADLKEMKSWFADPVIAEAIIDKTGHFYGAEYSHLRDKEGRIQRGEEIYAWLQEHPEVERYAVIDDDGDMDAVRKSFFQTDGYEGLTWKLTSKIISHLQFKERIPNHYRLNIVLNKMFTEVTDCLNNIPLEKKEECFDRISKMIANLVKINEERRHEKYKQETAQDN